MYGLSALPILLDGHVVSPVHDIPLLADRDSGGVLNMIVEIPRWTNAKMVVTDETMNPIEQETRKGHPRFVRNCFPHHGYIWNCGIFPQTWDNLTVAHSEMRRSKGDGGPLAVCEIGEQVGYIGQVKQVKVLGAISLHLAKGVIDWKILAIDINDPLAPRLKDINDVERLLPGLVSATKEWFRIYELPDGYAENSLAFGGQARGRNYTNATISRCHKGWYRLIMEEDSTGNNAHGVYTHNISFDGSSRHTANDNNEYLKLPPTSKMTPAPMKKSISKSFHIMDARICEECLWLTSGLLLIDEDS
ncbi:inorganic diphosphatase [Stereum hirsutum FP-91666 SS1]|uniref:inorganic diphosphatase n=1 Tax=Stereum hirsutum (strain FP-91666) TaxID=721885 RepID=UPI000440AE47|nr:inorganic diphosphatase [Stereum hirsutum FP-91666 SS1]EIM91108.1 inorganic diphosphatase [Stereum hirsutum FP-91666 SS1]